MPVLQWVRSDAVIVNVAWRDKNGDVYSRFMGMVIEPSKVGEEETLGIYPCQARKVSVLPGTGERCLLIKGVEQWKAFPVDGYELMVLPQFLEVCWEENYKPQYENSVIGRYLADGRFRLTIFPGNRKIPSAVRAMAKRWGKPPKVGERTLCAILWLTTDQGYIHGIAYPLDEFYAQMVGSG